MMVKVSAEEYRVWTQYIRGLCGITLDENKAYLIENRFADLLRETGATSFSELYAKVRAEIGGGLRRKVIDAITTRETSFFRDMSPFDLLQHKVLPDVIDAKTRAAGGRRPIPIRIWSAACSSGQEVYSIAMVARELLGTAVGYDVQIMGTDISNDAVAQASYATYTKNEIERGLASDRLRKYFEQHGDRWRVRDEVRALATFRQINLLEPFPFHNRFDIIFCRNVAIYFSETDKRRLFDRLGQSLEPQGALIIGSTESIAGLCPQFEPKRHLRSVYYQLSSAHQLAVAV